MGGIKIFNMWQKDANEENISKFQRFKRATRTFGDLPKREIKEVIRNGKSSGFANDRVLYKKFIFMIYYT